MSSPIRVVIADDSPFVCALLTSHLESEPSFQVVATAPDGARAVRSVSELRPDVLTLDLEMPGLSGLQALEEIMRDCPTPTVVVSGVSGRAAFQTMRALELGAVDFVLKYVPGSDLDPENLRKDIVAKVKAAAGIRVIRSLRMRGDRAAGPGDRMPPRSPAGAPERTVVEEALVAAGVVVVAASTGGPLAVRELLQELPVSFPAAVIVVQHLPETFTGVLAAQLDRHLPLEVREARAGDRLAPGRTLVAPGGWHLLLGHDARVQLHRGPEIQGHRPSADVTMQSVAQVYGSRTRGVVLTGMGADGTQGLVAVRVKGGRTYAQEARSCVVDGMPQRAIERGVVDVVATPAAIGRLLAAEVPRRREERRAST